VGRIGRRHRRYPTNFINQIRSPRVDAERRRDDDQAGTVRQLDVEVNTISVGNTAGQHTLGYLADER
jgi:hypothetical protein